MEMLHVLTLRVVFCVCATVAIQEMDPLVQVHRFKVVHNFYLEYFQTSTNVLLKVYVMRMQSVWTHKAALNVPATLATLEMGTHVWMLMSVSLILAIRMRLVQTITEASPVTVTQVSWEMELCVHVSVSA